MRDIETERERERQQDRQRAREREKGQVFHSISPPKITCLYVCVCVCVCVRSLSPGSLIKDRRLTERECHTPRLSADTTHTDRPPQGETEMEREKEKDGERERMERERKGWRERIEREDGERKR